MAEEQRTQTSEEQLPELRAIIAALVARTREGGVEWEWKMRVMGMAGGRCVAELANGSVLLAKDRDYDTVITIRDSDSNVLAEINVGYREYADLKPLADELYDLARRSALRVDSKLESILEEIRG